MLHSLWLVGGVFIEIYARILGAYDVHVRNYNPFVWDTATSTKNLALVEDTEDEPPSNEDGSVDGEA
jgi:hypothetical protein